MITGPLEEGWFMADSLLDQRVAVVTGAGQGSGRPIARSLTGAAARVVLAELVDTAATAVDEGQNA